MIKLNPDYRSAFKRQGDVSLDRQIIGFQNKAAVPKTLPNKPESHTSDSDRFLTKKSDSKRPRNQNFFENENGSSNSRSPESQFLNQIHESRLLTNEEERKLTQQIFRYRQAFNRLILREPEVVGYIADLLSQWSERKVRLDFVCNVALSETAKRKILEPAIRSAIPKLNRLPAKIRAADQLENPTAERDHRRRQRLHRATVALIESLAIRPRTFESAPFKNPKAKRLLKQYQHHCQKLTQYNLRLVIKVARKICGNTDRLMDAIQDGTEGLMHAVTKFDHKRNLRFSTYAIPWIRQTIFAALPNSQRLIRLPQSFRSVTKKIESEIESMQTELESVNNDSANVISKVADRLNLKSTVVMKHLTLRRDANSLSQPYEQGSDSTMLDVIPTNQPNPRMIAQKSERIEQIQSVLMKSLTKSERRVITLRYGLSDGRFRTFAEVGKIIGITRERVRQIEKPALNKLGQIKMMDSIGK